MHNADEIIEFWFSEHVSRLWFNSTPEFDQEIMDKYTGLFEQAINGELDYWADTAQGALALVILLDQFPLNMYRGQARCFAGEKKSLEIASMAIDKGLDQQIDPAHQAFLYMPFMHSENLADQDKAIKLFAAAGLEDNLRYARHHRGIVEKFGRFPHRNQILGRDSTAEERAYLSSKEAFLG